VDSITVSPSNPRQKRSFGVFIAGIFGATIALAMVAALVTALGGVILRHEAALAQPRVAKDYTRSLHECTGDAGRAIQSSQPDFQAFKQVWVTCANQIYLVDLMEDFDIRREKLIRQELDERVILWMVVGITMSGVLLAALQLFGSFKLAAAGAGKFGDQSSISIEAGKDANKISLQSSVTGLMILVVSLAFFIVYVKWIYAIQEVSIEKPQSLSESTTTGKISGYGSLGQAPVPGSNAAPPSAGPEAQPGASAPVARTPVAKSNKGARP
jgi:hypothetical protein